MEESKNKWEINRAGLFNYWYYEDEVFDFAGGKLLLRGNNGAGKSVTMQSFLPVLLDGSTRPERLDPFGSKARRMEDYLLGEKDVNGYDERTGYLYMEFKRKETEQYITIGIGLKARRGSQLNFWGFVITDNRRIGKDLLLYNEETHDGKKVKIPLSKIQLRNQISEGGQLVDTRKEYAALVNNYVFGYDTIDKYEDLIKLLIQLRSPKLSKDFRPTVIYEILEEALPPLSEEDLRHLSDTIEQMDQTKQQLEQLTRESEAVAQINKVYSAYNEKVLYDQATGYKKASELLGKEEHTYQSKLDKKRDQETTVEELHKAIQEAEINKEAAEKHRQRLEQHKVWNLEQERQEKIKSLETDKNTVKNNQSRLDASRKKEHDVRRSLDRVELELKNHQDSMVNTLDDLDADALESSFEKTHRIHREDYIENSEDIFAFNAWDTQVSQHLVHLEKVTEDLRELERLKKQFEDKNKELGRLKQELDESRIEESDWEEWFASEKTRHLNKIHEWIQAEYYLSIADQSIQDISRALDGLYVDTRYEEVQEPIREAVSEYESIKRGEAAEVHVQIKRINETITELEQELEEWKNKKDPDPDTHPESRKFREELKSNNIQAVPLYSAVEFREDVDTETQKRIEGALLETGLLDALITEEEIDLKYDRILKPNPQIMAYTLADILKPDLDEIHIISEELVDQVLRSILIDDSDAHVLSISEKGYYTLGVMKGHAVPVETVRFIGKNARQRYREEQIASINQQLRLEEDKREELERKYDELNQNISYAKEQFSRFPNDKDLAEGYSQLQTVRINLRQLNGQVARLSEELKIVGNEHQELKNRLNTETKNNTLKLDLFVYLEAVKCMRFYEKRLGELKRIHSLQLNAFQRRDDFSERLDELETEIIEVKGYVNVYQSNVDLIQTELEEIKKQIEQEGLSDVRHQVEVVQRSIREVTEMLEAMRDERSTKSRDLKYLDESIMEINERLAFWKLLKEAWELSFAEESARKFSAVNANDLSLKQRADDITSRLDHLSKQESSQLVGRLSRVRNDQQDDLIEYSPTQRTIRMETPEWMSTIDVDEFDLYIREWKHSSSRDLIEFIHQGKKVSPYIVENDLAEDMDRQKVYLDEQDKQLYEEILFQSVGNKLRSRIGRAERWVEEMKNMMSDRNDSSGLLFSIKWKPRTAETEEELDTKELVDLLRQDARLLKEEDIDRVTNHFRVKIERAKGLMNESTEMQTLLQVLKQVLDYRRWFSFELSYQRAGDDRKRPLTDNQFNKFSGGEKARAMYIPLFIATYSRYLEADRSAPYLISLDEAFAGVDDRNIADLFEVVEELGFNYIINSQALWGDYATVSELAISELFRPQNADHVAVIRYVWDGKRRKLVTETND